MELTGKFIYVFSEDAKAYLISGGAKLMQSDDRTKVYTFLTETVSPALLQNISYIPGDTLIF